jgi:hypothetical protein
VCGSFLCLYAHFDGTVCEPKYTFAEFHFAHLFHVPLYMQSSGVCPLVSFSPRSGKANAVIYNMITRTESLPVNTISLTCSLPQLLTIPPSPRNHNAETLSSSNPTRRCRQHEMCGILYQLRAHPMWQPPGLRSASPCAEMPVRRHEAAWPQGTP